MRVVVYGSRPDGHAKVVTELFQGVGGVEIVGLIDDLPENRDRRVHGLTVVGALSSLAQLQTEGLEGVALGFGDSGARAEVCERIIGLGLALPSLVHHTSKVMPSASIGAGVQVLAMAYVGPGATLLDGALVNTGAIVEHDVEVGRGGVVGPGATLAGRVRVGQEALIGAGATVLPDRRVGVGATVGAGAVVAADVRPGETVVGVPARPVYKASKLTDPALSVPPSGDIPELIDALQGQLAALEQAVASLRELVGRAYEQTPAAAARVLGFRRSATYTDAYSERPLVSVRIGTFRGEDMLFNRALPSIRAQTYEHWEAVVVCDGPDEAIGARVAALRDPRIRCFERPRNGPYPEDPNARWQVAGVHPFNEGVARAHGAWIAPIDQDDEWTPDHIETLLSQAHRSKAEVAYGAFRAVIAGEGETYFGGWPPEQGNFGFQAAIYHAGLAEFVYDVNSHLLGEPADWNLARRMLEAGVRFDFVPLIVGTYYVEEDSGGLGWWRARLADRGPFEP